MDESKYVKLIRARYDHGQKMSYAEEARFLALLDGPEAYQNEDEMLKYVEDHPDATLDNLMDYWDSITPDGLPPGDDGADLLDDDEDADA